MIFPIRDTPEEVVEGYYNQMDRGNFEGSTQYLAPEHGFEAEITYDEMDAGELENMTRLAESIDLDFEILAEDENDEVATVTVGIKVSGFNPFTEEEVEDIRVEEHTVRKQDGEWGIAETPSPYERYFGF